MSHWICEGYKLEISGQGNAKSTFGANNLCLMFATKNHGTYLIVHLNMIGKHLDNLKVLKHALEWIPFNGMLFCWISPSHLCFISATKVTGDKLTKALNPGDLHWIDFKQFVQTCFMQLNRGFIALDIYLPNKPMQNSSDNPKWNKLLKLGRCESRARELKSPLLTEYMRVLSHNQW